MYLFKCFWDTFTSFIGYYEVAQETGAKVVTSKQSHDAFKATSKWPTVIPLLASTSLSVINLSVNAKPIFVFFCKHYSQALMIGVNYLKHVLQFYLTT